MRVDFLDSKGKIYKKDRKKITPLVKGIIYLIGFLIIICLFFGFKVISSSEEFAKSLGNLSLWGQIKRLISSENKAILGENEDRINLLLLGISGENHEGPLLTDTVILASLKPSSHQLALISIPRDLLVFIPNYGWWKINHAYAFAESKNPGSGGELTSQVVSQIFDLPIHYYVRIDFEGFKRVIDSLGGIEMEIENTLDDYYYPVPGKELATTTERYEHLYIPAGYHYLNGELALKFVRSRQALGIEGSDFARAKRQQKILLAIKDKILAFSTLINPFKISNVLEVLSAHLDTNLLAWEIYQLYQLSKEINSEQIIQRVLDDSPDGPLYSTIENEASVLKTKKGDFSELQLIAKNIFNLQITTAQRISKIEIQNGTKISGLAFKVSQFLKSLGYQIIKISNAPNQDYQKSVIYNLNPNTNPDTLANLQKILNTSLAPVLPHWLTESTANHIHPQTDILIILGQDLANF